MIITAGKHGQLADGLVGDGSGDASTVLYSADGQNGQTPEQCMSVCAVDSDEIVW